MTIAPPVRRTLRDSAYWFVAAFSLSFALLVATTCDAWFSRAVLASTALTCCAGMAIGDLRTGLLRNAWTAPFAVAAAGQLLIAATTAPSPTKVLAAALVVVPANTVLYAVMGLVGWVGFGDVKLVVGLSLASVALAGWSGLLLAPLALIFSSLGRAVVRSPSPRRPHGPALTCSFAAIALLSIVQVGWM